MAFGEETFIDAPVTPAPVFAYRALRAVFWGEEDTPDQSSKHTSYNKNKNVGSTTHAQPINKSPIQLTPSQKRKHAAMLQVSPTKSILRAPGAHTPRRALLKDISVTFKDLRKSVSPELAQKSVAQQPQRPQATNNEKENQLFDLKVKLSQDIPSLVSGRKANNAVQTTTSNVPNSVALSTRQLPKQELEAELEPKIDPTNFDAEAYMRSTEKEMKKLIKYGQKMREQARRQDEENIKLRALIETIKDENTRLRKQLERQDRRNVESKYTKDVEESLSKSQPKPRISTEDASRSENKTKTKASISTQDVMNFDLIDLDEPAPTTKHRSSHKHTKQPLKHAIPTTSRKPAGNPSPASHSTSPPASPAKKPRQNPAPNQPSTLAQSQSQSQPQSQHNLPLRPTTNDPGNRLAPDRLAAARARVKKKAEMRKASVGPGAETDVEGRNGGTRGDASLGEVDWAGL